MIKLTLKSNKIVHINQEHVSMFVPYYDLYATNEKTEITLYCGTTIHVQESPEEVQRIMFLAKETK